MSLITLRSSAHTNGSTLSESAALISNFFKEGIRLRPGNTLELVSMSITKLEKFEIIQGENDVFIWRIGTGPADVGGVPNFSQHQVTLPAGNYNGADLAQTLQDSLNNSTLLGCYRGGWTASFTGATTGPGLGANAKFTINYAENTLPPSNGQTQTFSTIGAGNTPNITKEPNHIKVEYTAATGDDNWQNIENGFYGDKSIYANGGEFEVHIAPVKDLDSVNLAGVKDYKNLPTGNDWNQAPGGQVETFDEVGIDANTIATYRQQVRNQPAVISWWKTTGATTWDYYTQATAPVAADTPTGSATLAGSVLSLTGTAITFTATQEPTAPPLPNTFSNWETDVVEEEDVLSIWTEPGNLPNDWSYKIDIEDGETGVIGLFALPGSHGVMLTATIDSQGLNYAAGDTGTFTTNGNGTGAAWEVIAVDAAGEITTLTATGGDNYKTGDSLFLVDSGGGSGIDGTAVVGTLTSNDGNNYNTGDTGNLVGGTGTSATYNVISVNGFGGVLTMTIENKGIDYTAGDSLTLVSDIGGGGNGAKILVETTTREVSTYFGRMVSDGYLGIATTTGTDANLPGSWDVGRMKYNKTTNVFDGVVGTGGGGDFLENATLKRGGDGTDGSGGPFTPTLANFCYPEGRFGRSRDILIQGITDYPGNIDARINEQDKGQDVSIHLTNNATYTDIGIQVTGFTKAPGTDYPLPNWRNAKNLTPVVNSASWNTLARNPANWAQGIGAAQFNYGTDHIRIRLEQYGVRNNRFYISHDKGGDQGWINERQLLQTADTNNAITFTSTIRERLYPYCPTAFLSAGSRFDPATYKFFGIFDTERIASVPGLIGSSDATGTSHDPMEESEEELKIQATPVGAPQAALTLGYIVKAGVVDAANVHIGAETGAGANEISNRSLVPNIANINLVLGLEQCYTFQTGKETNTIESATTISPQTSLQEPSLHVELPDFNIKSFSGESGDTGRAVAVIPKEQWTTDSKSGTLQYVAPYPIPIDLNIPTSMVINEINARLRQPSGEIANDLINPTEICLRLTESDESKQQRIMNNALRQMYSVQSNIQDGKISNFNMDMPKL